MKHINQVLIEGDLICTSAGVYWLKNSDVGITVYPATRKVDDSISGVCKIYSDKVRVRIVGRLDNCGGSVPLHIDADMIEVKP